MPAAWFKLKLTLARIGRSEAVKRAIRSSCTRLPCQGESIGGGSSKARPLLRHTFLQVFALNEDVQKVPDIVNAPRVDGESDWSRYSGSRSISRMDSIKWKMDQVVTFDS